jgi:hypothetical protein
LPRAWALPSFGKKINRLLTDVRFFNHMRYSGCSHVRYARYYIVSCINNSSIDIFPSLST